MNYSAKIEYACLAVLELAAHYGSRAPVRVRQIADAHGAPSQFLVQILLQLKGAGLVSSTRGAAGGYQLIKPPDEITLGDVIAVVEGPLGDPVSSASEETPASRVLLSTWREIASAERDLLAGVTIAELAEQVRGETEHMYYI